MKNLLFLFLAIGVLTITSCSKDPVEIVVDSSQPQGTLTVSKTGTIVEQSDTKSKGTITLVKDSKGTEFLKFSTDFMTVLATGTVSVYLSTSAVFKTSPGTGNPDLRLVGPIARNGELFFKMDPTVPSKFTHVILWCGTASVPFGNAQLK